MGYASVWPFLGLELLYPSEEHGSRDWQYLPLCIQRPVSHVTVKDEKTAEAEASLAKLPRE